MDKYIEVLEKEFSQITNGFKEEEKKALTDFKSHDKQSIMDLSYLAYRSEVYQVRMYGVFLFGYLSEEKTILQFMKEKVSQDENWRVQEVLAKSFDEFCKKIGYEQAIPVIDDWLKDERTNVKRAVTEGLRIWTSRPYFKENPQEAITRLSALKMDDSDYVRKSVGNALRDISKEHPNLIKQTLDRWDLDDKKVKQVHKLASKFL